MKNNEKRLRNYKRKKRSKEKSGRLKKEGRKITSAEPRRQRYVII